MNEIVSQFDTLTLDYKPAANLDYWMRSCLDAEARADALEAKLVEARVGDQWLSDAEYAGELRAELDAARAESEHLSKELDEALMERGAWQDTAARWEREFRGKAAELVQARRDLRSAYADRDVARSELDAMRAENERRLEKSDTCEQQLEAAKGDLKTLLTDFHDMERRCGEWQEKARNCAAIGQVTDNGDGTETRILPVRMKRGLVPDGYDIDEVRPKSMSIKAPWVGDNGHVVDGDHEAIIDWSHGNFRLQLKPKGTP